MTQSAGDSPDTEPSVGEAEMVHDRHKLEMEVQAKKSVADKMQAFWDAEKELKAAMPGAFSALNVERLEKAIEVAKENDVHVSNPKSVQAAEKALRDGRAKAELAASKVKKPTPEQEKKAEAAVKKQAEEGLKAAMPNVFSPVYPDQLKSAIDAAKEIGADPSKIAAAELALEAALERKETEAAHKEYEMVVAARKAEKTGEKKAAAQEKAKAKAEAKRLRDAELELKAAMPGVFVEKANPTELQEAIAKAKAAGVKEIPIAAAEAALQEARDSERLQASAKAAAAAMKKMEAEEKETEKARSKAEALEKAKAKAEADALEAAEVELKAAMPTVFSPAYPARLTDAIAEAKQTGVTRQLVAEAEAALREVHRNTPKADLEADALRHAEQKLKGALPSMFSKADPAKLQAAIDQAKEAGVSAAKLAAAEAALASAVAKKAGEVGAAATKAGSAVLSTSSSALAGASSLTSLTFPGATPEELEEAKQRLRTAFDKYDTNHSGKLDHKELRNALKEVGLEMDSGKAKELLNKYDKDQSGLMEFDEFVELCIALNRVALNLAGTISEKDMKAAEQWSAFNKYDTNHSGKLDHKELRNALKEVGLEMDSGKAKELLTKYDKDQSGLMEFDEFQELCTAFEAVNLNLAGKELQNTMKAGPLNLFGLFGVVKVDTAKLEAAVEKAKKAGVDSATLAAAEAKLAAAEAKKAGAKAGSAAAAAGSAAVDAGAAAGGAAIGAGKAAGSAAAGAGAAAAGAAIDAGKTAGAGAAAMASPMTSLTFPGATPEEQAQAKQRLRTAFDKYDTNHSGKLDHKELRNALKEVGLEMDSGKAKELLNKYDKDQSGLMEFDEFVELCIALEAINLDLAADATLEAKNALLSAMNTGNFFISKNDLAKLEAALEKAKSAGVDAATLAAGEAKLAGGDGTAATTADVEASSAAVVQAALQAATAAVAEAAVEPASVVVDVTEANVKEAEKQLKAAMPSMFSKADPAKLQAAIDQAKEAGVSAPKVAAAEAALAEATKPKGNAMDQYWGGGSDGAKSTPVPTPTPVPTTSSIASASPVTSLTFPGATPEEQAQAKQRLRTAFDKYDTNHSGKLDHKELRNALKEVGLEMDSGKAKELLNKYDKDQSGLMEFDEFVELCVALNRVNLNLAGTISEKDMKAAELWSAFNKYDTDCSGKLDHKELRTALETVKLSLDSGKAKELLTKYDKDQSGLMEFDEFQELCTALEAVNLNLASAGEDSVKRRKRRTVLGKTSEMIKGTASAVTGPIVMIGAKAAAAAKGPAMDDASVARRAAEEQLKAAMPTVFQPGYPQNLSDAIDAAKAAGVDPEMVTAAEAALAALEAEALEAGAATKAKAEADAMKAADAKLKAAMPLPFQQANSAKLKPAIEAARAAGASEALLASAEAALAATLEHAGKESTRAAEAALKAAMPLPFQRADPLKLKPAIAEAKKAGASELSIGAAEAKLEEAEAALKKEAEKEYEALKMKQEAEAAAAAAKVAAVRAKEEAAAAKEAAAAEKVQAAVRAKEEAAAAKEAAAKAKEEAAVKAKAEADEKAKAAVEAKAKAAEEAEAKAKVDAELKAAEAALKAVMPYPFQLADPTKLQPAIEAAKKAGVSGPAIEAAEAKLNEAVDKAKKAAEAQERAADEKAARARAEEAKKKVEAAARLKSTDSDGSLQAAFAKLDTDKSGTLDYKELRKALAAVGMTLDSKGAKELLAKYDKDGSGKMELVSPSPNPNLTTRKRYITSLA